MKKEILFGEARKIIGEWGVDSDNYMTHNVKQFMNSKNDPDDNSIELYDYHQSCLKIIVDAGLKAVPVEAEVVLTRIDVDKLAIRFTFADESGCNLFWSDLFVGQRYENFHVEFMRNIHRIYNECVENNIHPHLEDEAT